MAAVLLIGSGAAPFGLHLLAGTAVFLLLPVLLVNAKIDWPTGTNLHETLLYSLALVLVGILVGGLLTNQILLSTGVARPLDRIPVVAAYSVALLGLALWRPQRWRLRDGLLRGSVPRRVPPIAGRDQLVLGTGLLVVGMSIIGAIRLNNGGGGGVTTAMLLLAASIIGLVFCWRHSLREASVVTSIYLLSLALLLMTSLRGWAVTGHDVQREFRMFELASSQGFWSMEPYRSAYNACLSITILPTLIERTTGISDIYVYKTVYQMLYALCPVLIYLIARRFATRPVAILAAVYFVAFPTFFTDMPSLNRQEVAFFFLGVALLFVTSRAISLRKRQTGFVVLGVGVVLSHYSTTYVLLAVLTFGWIVTKVVAVTKGIRRRRAHHAQGRRERVFRRTTESHVVTAPVIAALAALTFLWAVPLTGAGGYLEETLSSVINVLGEESDGQRASDASYSIFGGEQPSPEQRLAGYRQAVIERTADSRDSGTFFPLAKVDHYDTPVVWPPEKLPSTTLGDVIEAAGVDVSGLNNTLRGGAPLLLQLFVGLGLLLTLAKRARGFRPSVEYLGGAIGCVAVMFLHVLLPNLSVDYGILRTFAQALFWLAPFLAVGSIQAFGWMGRAASMRTALAVAVVFFLSLTGFISQALGRYPPQLHLNNSGQHYDNCLLHAREVAAVNWLRDRIGDRDADVQAPAACYAYAITVRQRYSEPESEDDIFPVIVRTDAYVFLSYSNIRKHEAAFSFGGDLVTYRYPIEFLDSHKSLIYSSNGARIYR